MTKKQHVKKILAILDENYPKDIACFLDHTTPYELLIATILSAQCSDARVNIVTKDLFARYTTLEAFASADLEELESYVKSTGFYRTKAKNIIMCCQKLVSDFDGEVPSDVDQLITLAGVGRKTANVILSNIYNIPSVVVDTHVKRITNRWGLTEKEDPTAIEYDLMEILPKDHWIRYNTQVIAHGRAICRARSPKCEECFFLTYCPYGLQERLEKLRGMA
ncbi:MAG TPA: endonuclease III [Epulopiscium sp.]|nr:endonuclease III [Candidatus Epulonipiscium sp.]